LWQSLAERAKGWTNLLKDATAKEQQIIDLERELKKVGKAAAANKKKLEDELAEEKCKAVEATAQFNTMATGRSSLLSLLKKKVVGYLANCCVCRFP
jgi:hypothetical protein